jgi:hypothetical protein
MENGEPVQERAIGIDPVGTHILMSSAVRYDESSGLFYTIFLEQGYLVIREYNLKDFAP